MKAIYNGKEYNVKNWGTDEDVDWSPIEEYDWWNDDRFYVELDNGEIIGVDECKIIF